LLRFRRCRPSGCNWAGEPNPLYVGIDPGAEERGADGVEENVVELLVGVLPEVWAAELGELFLGELSGELTLMDARADSLTVWVNGSLPVRPELLLEESPSW